MAPWIPWAIIAVLILIIVIVFLTRGDKALKARSKELRGYNKNLREKNKAIDQAVKDLEKTVESNYKKEAEANDALEKTTISANSMDELIAMHRKNEL